MPRRRKKHPSSHDFFEESLEKIRRDLESKGIEFKSGRSPRYESKISEHIVFLITPLMQTLRIDDIKMVSILVSMACIAWNISLSESPRREEMIEIALNALSTSLREPEMRKAIKDLFETWVQIKLAYFPDDRRIIASYKVIPAKEGFHIAVAALE